MKWHFKNLTTVFLIFGTLVLASGCMTDTNGPGSGGSSSSVTITYVDESGHVLGKQSVGSSYYGYGIDFDYTKTGYKNQFFDSKGKEVFSGYFTTDKSCKIKVKSTPISYTIKFMKSTSAYGTVAGSLPDDMTCNYDTEYTLPENNLGYTYFNETYKSRGWTQDSYNYNKKGEYQGGQKVKNLTTEDGATITLYACFSKDGCMELKFYKEENGYSYTTVYAENGEILSENSIPKLSKKGYRFDGFYLSDDTGKSIIDFTTYKVTGGASFKPKFTVATYTATFVTERGTAPKPVTWAYSSSSYSAEKIDLTKGEYVLTATGYNFKGWFKPGDSYSKTSINGYYDDDDLTLTAKWEPWTASIQYLTNAPDGVYVNGSYSTSQTFYYNTAQNLWENRLSASGYKFKGWNTKADGSGTSYQDEALFTWKGSADKEKITLYAQWEKLQTAVTVKISEPDTTYKDIFVNYKSDTHRFEVSSQLSGLTSCKWYIDGVENKSVTGTTLSAYLLENGQHSIMVTTVISGVTYGDSILVNVSTSTGE